MSIRIDRFLAACFLSVLAAPPALAQADDKASTNLQRGIKAMPVQRAAPHYPSNELTRGRQGWVQLSYVVTTDGKVVDPVVQDSSGSPSFEKAALRAVQDWAFEPATWNGKPVQQCDTKVMLTFAIDGNIKKVSPKFSRLYRRIDKLLLDGELEAARDEIDETFASFDMTRGVARSA
jgi:TonB family protein